MEVILTKDVDALGGKNEVVRVKDGYARNYLFPLRVAIPATAGNLKALKDKIRLANEAKTKRIDAAKVLAEKLSKLHLEIIKKAGKEGKLFGAVTSQELAEKIKEISGIEVDKKRIHLPPNLKSIGAFTVAVRLEVGVSAVLHLDVRSDEPVKPAEEPEVEAMPETEGKQGSKSRRAREAAGEQSEETAAPAPEVRAQADEESDKKRAKKKSESEAELPEEAAAPKKRKRKGVNEAEMDLPE